MASLVTEVILNSGKLAKENIVSKVYDFKYKVQNIKSEVFSDLKKQYSDFSYKNTKLAELIKNSEAIDNDYNELCSLIEREIKPQMKTSVIEFNDLVEDFKNVKKLREVTQCACDLHNHLTDAIDSTTQLKYLEAVQPLLEFERIINTMDIESQTDIFVISSLNAKFKKTKGDVIFHLLTLWQERVSISVPTNEKNPKCTFKIMGKESRDVEILVALNLLKQLNHVLKEFGKQFINSVCKFTLLNTVTVKESSDNLTIRMINDNSPNPNEAFAVLKQCFSFLHNDFFCLPVSLNESRTAMNEFGAIICDELCSIITEECLKKAIPTQSKQLELFHKEIIAAEEFCKFLQNIGFISSSENQLISFIHDVDILPLNKMAQDLMKQARSLMQRGLQTIEVVSPDVNSLQDTILFPKCQVSSSIIQLVKLLLDVKEEAKNIDSLHSFKLFYVARKICELYCCVVPTYHKEEIKNIPQQAAIFHNNCMYLANCLTLLGPRFQSDLHLDIPMTFIDLVPEIKKLGAEVFLSQMRLQKQQLLQLLQEQQVCGGLLVEEGTANKAEKAVRQSLCQLQLLKKVWSDILPEAVYFKSIGTLFNTCLEELILRVSSMEDIAADAAAQYDNIFAIVLKQGPELFKVDSVDQRDSVHLYVRRWFKFQELQLVLSASMREIVDRWASGKGPLASHFTAEEVKHLIRALFQNTERRAAALAKIR